MKMFDAKTEAASKELEKVIVPLEQDAWHGFTEEVMWAKEVNNGQYELQNTPFFAKGLAFLDVVTVQSLDGRLVMTNVSRHSRHSTYRALIQNDTSLPQLEKILKDLAIMNCTYESYKDTKWTLYTFDIPPSSVDLVYKVLDSAGKQGVLDFEEGHFGGRDN